jgi:hypothetical protein
LNKTPRQAAKKNPRKNPQSTQRIPIYPLCVFCGFGLSSSSFLASLFSFVLLTTPVFLSILLHRQTFIRRSIMDTVTAIIALLKELGTPAITVIGFAWVLFRLKKLEAKGSSDIAGLRTELKTDISGLEAKVSALDAKVSGLRADVQSIKGNHLPHIEAAIKALAEVNI